MVKENELYMHLKSKQIYQIVIPRINIGSRDDWTPESVVYRNIDTNEIWSRPVTEFTPDKYQLVEN